MASTMNILPSKKLSYFIKPVFALAIMVSIIFLQYAFFIQYLKESRITALTATVIPITILAALISIYYYRKNKLGDTRNNSDNAIDDFNAKFISWIVSPLVFITFLFVYWASIFLIVFLVGPFVIKLLSYTSPRIESFLTFIIYAILLVLYLLGYLLSFLAVRWIWKQGKLNSAKDQTPKGSDG